MRSLNPNRLIRLILKTPSFQCNPASRAEIHSLSGRSQLLMYLAAVKSFLRFYSDVGIVLHDDGSLRDKERALLREHIRGIRIIGRSQADEKMARLLRPFPNAKRYRATNLISLQLFDYAVFSRKDKIISLDSDTLFIRRPNRLIGWIREARKEIICSFEHRPERQRETLSRFNCKFPAHFCAGFFCYYKRIIALNKIEKILAKMETFGWFTTQNTMPILIQNKSKKYKVSFFRIPKYQNPWNFEKEPIFRHYWLSALGMDKYIADFVKIVPEIYKKR